MSLNHAFILDQVRRRAGDSLAVDAVIMEFA